MLLLPMQHYMGKFASKPKKQWRTYSDKTITIFSEVINQIKNVKMYAWENFFLVNFFCFLVNFNCFFRKKYKIKNLKNYHVQEKLY